MTLMLGARGAINAPPASGLHGAGPYHSVLL